jgi:hypothetical protein
LIFDLEDGVVTPQAQIGLISPIQKSATGNHQSIPDRAARAALLRVFPQNLTRDGIEHRCGC